MFGIVERFRGSGGKRRPRAEEGFGLTGSGVPTEGAIE
jgi:hypothetical protein